MKCYNKKCAQYRPIWASDKKYMSNCAVFIRDLIHTCVHYKPGEEKKIICKKCLTLSVNDAAHRTLNYCFYCGTSLNKSVISNEKIRELLWDAVKNIEKILDSLPAKK